MTTRTSTRKLKTLANAAAAHYMGIVIDEAWACQKHFGMSAPVWAEYTTPQGAVVYVEMSGGVVTRLGVRAWIDGGDYIKITPSLSAAVDALAWVIS